jgi:hypothetical protein
METAVVMGVHLLGDMNLLVYDELMMQTELNVEVSQEVIFASFENLIVIPNGEARNKPIFTTLEFSPEEYNDAWAYIERERNKWLDFLN